MLLSGCRPSAPDWLPGVNLPWQREQNAVSIPTVRLASPAGADVSPAQLRTALEAFNTGRTDLSAELMVPSDYAAALTAIQAGEGVPGGEIITGTATTGEITSGALTETITLTGTQAETQTESGGAPVDALAGEVPADLFYVDSYTLPDLVAGGAVLPISSVISDTELAALTADFYPQLLDAFSNNGELYCLPHTFNTLALIYNRTLFDQAGQPYPTGNWGWNEMVAAAQAVVDLDITFYTTYGLVLNGDASRWLPFLYAAGGQLVSDDGRAMTIDSPVALDSLNAYLNLLLDGLALRPATLSSSWNGEAFAKGRTGMTVEGNWIVPYLREAYPDFSFGVAPLPRGAAGPATLFFSGCYAISAHAENPTAALEVALHLTSPDTLRTWSAELSAAPARMSLRETWLAQHPEMAPFVDGLAYARPWQFPPGMHAAIDALNGGMVQALNGDIPPEEVLRVADVIGSDILGAEE